MYGNPFHKKEGHDLVLSLLPPGWHEMEVISALWRSHVLSQRKSHRRWKRRGRVSSDWSDDPTYGFFLTWATRFCRLATSVGRYSRPQTETSFQNGHLHSFDLPHQPRRRQQCRKQPRAATSSFLMWFYLQNLCCSQKQGTGEERMLEVRRVGLRNGMSDVSRLKTWCR